MILLREREKVISLQSSNYLLFCTLCPTFFSRNGNDLRNHKTVDRSNTYYLSNPGVDDRNSSLTCDYNSFNGYVLITVEITKSPSLSGLSYTIWSHILLKIDNAVDNTASKT